MKEYRFFISSTFKDMQQERDAIRDVVLPEIELLASKYGIVVSIVDLRWGISTEDCESNDEVSLKIFRSCFDEIDESKPFFIGLLGNRYGWIPDLNSNKLDLISNDNKYSKYSGVSITEAEILYALETFGEKGVFIFASRKGFDGKLNEEDKKIFESIDKADKERIDSLKKKIKSDKRVEFFEYSPKISDGILKLDEFSSRLIALITEKIKSDFETRSDLNEFELLKEAHNNKIELTHRSFSGREKAFDIINNFYESGDVALALVGESGSGKSMILQEEINRRLNNNDTSLYFLLGVGEKSNLKTSLVASLYYQTCNYLKTKFPKKYFDLAEVENDYDKVISKLYLNLSSLSKTGRVYLFIDALDQMNEVESFVDFIYTRYLSENKIDIKIIVTTTKQEEIINELTLKLFVINELPKLSQDDIMSITEHKLSLEKKTLNKSCMDEIVDKSNKYDSPLYLSLLVQKISNLNYLDFKNIQNLEAKLSAEEAIYYYIRNVISGSASNIDGLLFDMIGDAKRKINERFVYLVLGIISMSRNGVREKDIQGIFKQLNEPYSSTDFSYLRKMFRNFINNVSSYYDFSHKIIDNALENYYFNKNHEQSIEICNQTLNYLDTLSNTDSFKKHEYMFYAYRANDKERFIKYLQGNHSQDDFYSLFDLFDSFETGNVIDKFFESVLELDNEIIKDLVNSLPIAGEKTRKKVCLLLLNKKDLSKENKILLLQTLAVDERRFGKDKNALIFSSYAFKESIKSKFGLDESFKIRANLLLELFKFISAEHLFKTAKKVGVSDAVIDEYRERYLSIRKNKIDEKGYTSFVNNLLSYSVEDLYKNSKYVLNNLSLFADKHGEDIERILESKIVLNAQYETIQELTASSNLLYLISLVKQANKKDNAKEYLMMAKKNLYPVRELLETKEDLHLYARINNQLSSIDKKNKAEEKLAYKKYIAKQGRDINYTEAVFSRIMTSIIIVVLAVFCVLSTICFSVADETFYALVGMNLKLFVYNAVTIMFVILSILIIFFLIYCLYSVAIAREKFTYNAHQNKIRSLFLVVILVLTEVFLFTQINASEDAGLTILSNNIYSISAALSFVAIVRSALSKNTNTLSIEDKTFYIEKRKKVNSIYETILILFMFVVVAFTAISTFKAFDLYDFIFGVCVFLINVLGIIFQSRLNKKERRM